MILILDFGSQYTQLIARRVRELHVYCEIHPFDVPLETIRRLAPEGIILSGGPASVYDDDAPMPAPAVLDELRYGTLPVLGICYGMGVLNLAFGGEAARSAHKEFGPADVRILHLDPLFALGGGRTTRVWMSHGDRMTALGGDLETLAASANSPYAAFRHREKPIYGVQFHPEVTHTADGREILRNFVLRVAGARPDWTMESFVDAWVPRIRQRVGAKRVICALSGGVDSTVTAALVHSAIGDRLTCIFVDNGLLRAGEVEEVLAILRERLELDVRPVDAAARFLRNLGGVEDPEQKRRIIGTTFIEVFEEEPRAIAAVDADRAAIVRAADAIVQEEIRRAELYEELWQAFAVLLPVKTVGVMGDERTYENVIAIRAVHSTDGMTADWARLPSEVLARLSSRIINEVRGVNRVVYDISSKPPATIEWE